MRAGASIAVASGMVLASLSGSRAGAAEPSPSGFHGRDITGYKLDYNFRLDDAKEREPAVSGFKGKVTLLFFGFTQCPAICPAELARAVEIKKLLGPDRDRFRLIFVSVDPARDTPQVVRDYAAGFDPSFIGISPSSENLRALSANFKFSYEKVGTGPSYTMDHSTTGYVFDPAGKIRVLFRHDATAADCADDIRKLLHESPEPSKP